MDGQTDVHRSVTCKACHLFLCNPKALLEVQHTSRGCLKHESWHFSFSQRSLWRCNRVLFVTQRHFVRVCADVSEAAAIYIITWCSWFLWNFSTYVPDYTAWLPRRLSLIIIIISNLSGFPLYVKFVSCSEVVRAVWSLYLDAGFLGISYIPAHPATFTRSQAVFVVFR